MKQLLALASLGFLALGVCGAEPSPAELLSKVSNRYKNMHMFLMDADIRIAVNQQGQTGLVELKTMLAVGGQGMFRVEQSEGGSKQVRVSDGKMTWKALPQQKVWSTQEVSSDESDEAPSEFQGKDLFAQAERSFITRYTGLARYAQVAVIDKSDRIKFNGGKVDCWVLRISIPGAMNRLYVAKDSLLVLRHIETQMHGGAPPTEATTEYKRIAEGMPPPELFEFQPANGSREVADVSLPGERDVSLVGQRAADFTLKTVNGEPVHLADLRGKVVLLDFWATWCQPCRHELPTIEALSRKYKERNVVVLGINDEDVSTAKHFLEKNHPDLETLHDSGKKVHRTYGCNAIPTVIVIDPQGKVVAHFVGQRPEEVFVAALKQAGMQ